MAVVTAAVDVAHRSRDDCHDGGRGWGEAVLMRCPPDRGHHPTNPALGRRLARHPGGCTSRESHQDWPSDRKE